MQDNNVLFQDREGTNVSVYIIENLKTGRIYIGVTNNFPQRIRCHLTHLNGNHHYSEELQTDFNKHGADGFKIEVIYSEPYINNDQRLKLERLFIATSDNLYNKSGADLVKYYRMPINKATDIVAGLLQNYTP